MLAGKFSTTPSSFLISSAFKKSTSMALCFFSNQVRISRRGQIQRGPGKGAIMAACRWVLGWRSRNTGRKCRASATALSVAR